MLTARLPDILARFRLFYKLDQWCAGVIDESIIGDIDDRITRDLNVSGNQFGGKVYIRSTSDLNLTKWSIDGSLE